VKRGLRFEGISHDKAVDVIEVQWQGTEAIAVYYKDERGRPDSRVVFRSEEATLKLVDTSQGARTYGADGDIFRLVSEANRIKLAYLFDPMLAVHTSKVIPLPHQLTAVYEAMLPRQPLKFLLADDPGAGKTIMAGLLMKELMVRGDLKRCLICCPGGLAEQWQDEMDQKFNLPFQLVNRALIEGDRTGNPFATYDFVIGRLDMMSRDETMLAKIKQTPDWDLIVCDEAHKMSCPWAGNEPKPTKRFKLGKELSKKTRHLLLMTATPHNGKDEDFQSFLQIIDPERFEGRPRNDEKVDAKDIMRRLVKEEMVRFDGTRLFPERKAYTPVYELTPEEMALYNAVTMYVSTEMNRVERLAREGQGKRGAIVGFAMTGLQRRLASSPEAIYQSLNRRHENLKKELEDIKQGKRKTEDIPVGGEQVSLDDEGDVDEDEYDEKEAEDLEAEVTTHVTAAETIPELEAEIATLSKLVAQAQTVRASGNHGKWNKLSEVLKDEPLLFGDNSRMHKIIIFTEHRDTLTYITTRIRSLLGKPDAVVNIHGGLGREERRYNQSKFQNDKDVLVLVATDAAGEGVNLQQAHLMINYDIPWNPNRLEQRFGRIHRIGQTEICHMWNLVAKDTREGQVFQRVFEKLDREREALGDRVFDVLGRAIEAKALRDLIMEAIRYGDQPEVRARQNEKIDNSLDRERIKDILEEAALSRDSMAWGDVLHIKEELERAEARKLQPLFIQAFFIKAFQSLGGTIHTREGKRFEISHVPAALKHRAEVLPRHAKLQDKYERITFEKDLITVVGKPIAELLSPGHPLLDATIELVRERNPRVLEDGAILLDDRDKGTEPRALWYIQSEILDARTDAEGNKCVICKQLNFVEMDGKGKFWNAGYAPYLDYKPLTSEQHALVSKALTHAVLSGLAERPALDFASSHILPEVYMELKKSREELVEKTWNAVKARLTREIAYWDQQCEELKARELKGQHTRLSSGNARKRADDLQARLNERKVELEKESHVEIRQPYIIGCALVVPMGMLASLTGQTVDPDLGGVERDVVEQLAVDAVMAAEKKLGREPKDVGKLKIGYDIESKVPATGELYFIEVKGRQKDGRTVTISSNEIRTGLNKPDRFILAIVLVEEGGAKEPKYVWQPFTTEPTFDTVSVNFDIKKLLERGEVPS
jgi:SNF2 family DNA or RNA helicase